VIVMRSLTHVFQLLPITWQTFSTIATFLAVLVAIFLPSWRDRRRLQLSLRIGQMIVFGIPPTEHLRTYEDPNSPFVRDPALPVLVTLTVTNAGRLAIIIDGWEMRFTNQPLDSKSLYVKPERVSMPVELAHGKGTQLVSSDEQVFERLPCLIETWVRDTLGKKWRISKAQVRRIRTFKRDLSP